MSSRSASTSLLPRRLATLSAPSKAALAALCLSVAPLLLAHVAFTPMYQESDDAYMNMIACGAGVCDKPDYHLLFINVVLGKMLSRLYSSWPDFPWYRFAMLVAQFVAVFASHFILLRDSFTIRRLLLCTLYAVAFDLFAYVNPQFTVTACLVMQPGVLAYLSARDSGLRFVRAFGFAVAVGVSSCIREESCKLILALGAPGVVLLFVRDFIQIRGEAGGVLPIARRWARRAAPLVLGVLVYLSLASLNRASYNTEGWQEFYEYGREGSWLGDYKIITYNPETKWIFDRVGWSRNDYNMFCNWGFLDPELFSLAKLKTINQCYRQTLLKSNRTGGSSQRLAFDMRATVGQLQDLLRSNYGSYFRLASLALLLSLITRQRWRVLIVAGTVLACLFVMVYFGPILHRAPLRVSFSVASFLACVMVWGSTGESARLPFMRLLRMILVAIVVALGLGFIHEIHRSSTGRTRLIQLHKQGIDHLRSMGRTLFVDWGASFHGEVLTPWGGPEKLRGIRLLLIGTTSRTPFTRARLQEFGINDFYKAIYTRDDVYVLLMNEIFYKTFKAYVMEHYNALVGVVSREFVPPPELTDGRVIIGIFKLGRVQRGGG